MLLQHELSLPVEEQKAISSRVKRAISVLDYINHKGIVRRRIVARGYGATKDEKVSKEEGRRVEVRIVDINEIEAGK